MSGEWFEVVTGVRQGCALFTFSVCDSAGLGIGKKYWKIMTEGWSRQMVRNYAT